MRHFFKEFFYYTKEQRRGVCSLVILIASIFVFGYMHSSWRDQRTPSQEEIRQQAVDERRCQKFLHSLHQAEQSKHVPFKTQVRRDKRIFSPKTLFNFNPNTADSSTFQKLGLPGWMIRNILRYRSKGGHFKKPEDFKKIYGLTAEEYSTLSPYIHLSVKDTMPTSRPLYHPASLHTPIFKYAAGTTIDLNKADTTELEKIPGIGSGIARMIVNYRERLGGYYQIAQLEEIHLDSKRLQTWFYINPREIRLLNLNKTGINRLRYHPYINFYQAKVFVEYRQRKGAISSLKPFTLYEEFTANDLKRISHYVCFN